MDKFPPSYYAVIFISRKTADDAGYAETAERMLALASKQKGFLGVDSARDAIGITVSYWESLQAIADWKAETEHQVAQHKGKRHWYAWYDVKICKVERSYRFGERG